ITSTPSASKIASNSLVNFVSWSRSRCVGRIGWSAKCIAALRACCLIQARAGVVEMRRFGDEGGMKARELASPVAPAMTGAERPFITPPDGTTSLRHLTTMKPRHALYLLATAAALLPLSCGPSDTITVQGAGATFPEPLYDRWFQEFYLAHPNVRVNYTAN